MNIHVYIKKNNNCLSKCSMINKLMINYFLKLKYKNLKINFIQ